jgi:hypothetical protein
MRTGHDHTHLSHLYIYINLIYGICNSLNAIRIIPRSNAIRPVYWYFRRISKRKYPLWYCKEV